MQGRLGANRITWQAVSVSLAALGTVKPCVDAR